VFPSNADSSKQALRSAIRQRRSQLKQHQLRAAANALCGNLRSTPEYQGATHCAAYLAVNGEMETDPILQQGVKDGKQLYLPVLVHQRLKFAPYRRGDTTLPNRFHIPEPNVPAELWVEPEDLDLALVPLVAFDKEGNRLGMGGGYYDRSFAFLRQPRHHDRPRLIGVGHHFQQTDTLIAEAWDVPMDCVVTDKAVHRMDRT
jgi:5-formyltetrahydrofolate cyclo-ligase